MSKKRKNKNKNKYYYNYSFKPASKNDVKKIALQVFGSLYYSPFD